MSAAPKTKADSMISSLCLGYFLLATVFFVFVFFTCLYHQDITFILLEGLKFQEDLVP